MKKSPTATSSPTVRELFRRLQIIAYPENGQPVDKTVAEEIRDDIAFLARANAARKIPAGPKPALRVAVAGEPLIDASELSGAKLPAGNDWMFFRLSPNGSGELTASRPHLLYALFRRLKERWLDRPASEFEKGVVLEPAFTWLEGGDNYIANPKITAKGYDPEATMKELARLGYSHVPVNALAREFPAEQGPPGEIYYRFYYSSPELDQFAETPLNKGSYSPEYLRANLSLLKKHAALAVKYGLTPGMNICAPRSVPESLLAKYPFLRGARVDHPFRSYRPRFTLTLSHPVVRWHYAELMRSLMKEIPELGYLYVWTNDSGSGFEYTASLYAGRNGGAYLVREWKSPGEIERAAAANVLRFFRTLRDAASETNPDFRVLFNLFSFAAEEDHILAGLSDRLDVQIAAGEADGSPRGRKLRALQDKGSELVTSARFNNNFLLGIPFPWLVHEQATAVVKAGFRRANILVDPPSLAPFDINREVLCAVNLGRGESVDALVKRTAVEWVGPNTAPLLVAVWKLCDTAVRAFPEIPLYGNTNWAFPWYRLFVRPLVPDIGRIPESERAYYEKFMIATFNNPTLVDPSKDVLFTLMTREQADRIVVRCDAAARRSLDKAIDKLCRFTSAVKRTAAEIVMSDQRDRLIALRCYFRTLRNTAAWVAGVHGYLEAKTAAGKAKRRKMVRDMVRDEIRNALDLMALVENSKVTFMPISSGGETYNMYGENLAELIKLKIGLMEAHAGDKPGINPDFMWRLPEGTGVPEKEYLKY